MAKKKTLSAATRSQIAKAIDALGECHTPMYSLDDIAKSDLGYFAARDSVLGVKAMIEKELSIATKALPGEHPACAHIAAATKALHSLEVMSSIILAAHETGDNVPYSDTAFNAAASKAMRQIIAEAGRHMERAEIALAAGPSMGFLEGEMLDDGKDLTHFRSDDELLVLKQFRDLDSWQRNQVKELLAALKQRD